MYPRNYLSLFPAFPSKKRIFVAMSFDPRFDNRWKNVLMPAISSIQSKEGSLEPFRIDASLTSDAILTEILEGITSSAMILADITALSELDGKAVRNANVMYEIGIAHATRLPEEVLILRSDKFRLDFDISGVRVHQYDPDNDPEGAIDLVSNLLIQNRNSAKSRAHIALSAAFQRMTPPAFEVLLAIAMRGPGSYPQVTNINDLSTIYWKVSAIDLLLALGAIELIAVKHNPDLVSNRETFDWKENLFKYDITAFGRGILAMMSERCIDRNLTQL